MIAELLQILGPSLLTRFLAVFAGTRVTFPKTPSGPFFGQLERIVGTDAAERLRDRFAGEQVYIPRNSADDRAKRQAEIAARLACGEKPADIARSFRLSYRTVLRIGAGLAKGSKVT